MTHARAKTRVKTAAGGAPAGGHVVDRALAVHALLTTGRTPVEVQRRLGKSKGYVSVLGYLGAALAGLEPEDVARLRVPALTPRVVWPLVTRARTDERAALRQALGDAATDAARDDARRRARDGATVRLRAALRAHVQAAGAGLAAPPRPRGGRRPRAAVPILGALAWDPAAWAADPVAYARAHLAALAAAHQHIFDRATLATRHAGVEQVLATYTAVAGEAGLRRLAAHADPARWRALAHDARAARTPTADRALSLLASATRALHAAVGGTTTGIGMGADPPLHNATWAELEIDLGD